MTLEPMTRTEKQSVTTFRLSTNLSASMVIKQHYNL